MDDFIKINKKKIKDIDVEKEIEKLKLSIKNLEDDFNNISNDLDKDYDSIAEMYQLNVMMLNDPEILDQIINKISNFYSADYSVDFVFNKFIKQLKNTNDLLLKERAELLEEIKKLLLNNLLNNSSINFKKNDIIVTKTIETNLLFKIKEAGASGFVCQEGGLTSHSAIVARAFNIPSVINIKNLIKCCKQGEYAIIDAINGKFIINPSQDKIDEYKLLKKEINNKNKKLAKILTKKSETKDNKKVLIKSNLDNLVELQEYNLINSDGIGLVRTEILLEAKDIFNENKQYEYYKEISQKVYPNNVTFRIFDIGSDKYPDGFKFKEANPALGVRGIRFLFKNITLFKKQIRALLKASELKNIKILIPMISNLEDVEKSLAIIEEVKSELNNLRISYDKNIQIGFMIETPSAALMTKQITKLSDFISIGTNDLCQYLFAADRTNQDTSVYLSNESKLLFNVINNIVKDTHLEGKEVSICGEIAYNDKLTQLLIGTDVDELSLSFANIPNVKNELINSNYKECKIKLEKYIEN